MKLVNTIYPFPPFIHLLCLLVCKMEAARSIEMSQQTYDTLQYNNPEDCNFYYPKITEGLQLTFIVPKWVLIF
jgi:hypothetical protein